MNGSACDRDGPGGRPVERRRVLAGLTSIGVAALAGCLGDGDDGSEEDDEPDDSLEDVEAERRLNGEILRSSFPVELFEAGSDEQVAEIHYHTEFSHWHFQPLEVPLDGFRTVETRLYNVDDEVIPLGEGEQFHLEITRTQDTPEDLVELEINDGIVNFHGTASGEGELVFHVVDGDERVWTTPTLTVAVGVDGEEQ